MKKLTPYYATIRKNTGKQTKYCDATLLSEFSNHKDAVESIYEKIRSDNGSLVVVFNHEPGVAYEYKTSGEISTKIVLYRGKLNNQ